MTNTTHTPGPWKYSFISPSWFDIIGNGITIAVLAAGREGAENASLIAVAPCLLTQVKLLCDHLESPNTTPEMRNLRISEAREVIARATL